MHSAGSKEKLHLRGNRSGKEGLPVKVASSPGTLGDALPSCFLWGSSLHPSQFAGLILQWCMLGAKLTKPLKITVEDALHRKKPLAATRLSLSIPTTFTEDEHGWEVFLAQTPV